MDFHDTPINIDNKSAIDVTKNPVYHSRTKHIDIKHHFLRDCVEKQLIHLEKVFTDDNLADLYTKAFSKSRFDFLVQINGMKNAE